MREDVENPELEHQTMMVWMRTLVCLFFVSLILSVNPFFLLMGLLPPILHHSATLYLSQLLILDVLEWELNQE